MNLFYNPSLSELNNLLELDNQRTQFHNYQVVVDHDGEVVIYHNLNLPKTRLSRFKFYFNGLNHAAGTGYHDIKNLKFLNQLYKNLLFCWEREIKGEVNYSEITRLNNILYHKEIRTTRKKDYPVSIGSYR